MPLLQVVEEMHSLLQLVLQHKQEQKMPLGGDNATSGTAGGAAGKNQSTTSEIRMYIEQACISLQNNDTQGALVQLNLALNALGGGSTQGSNTTTTTTTTGGEDGISVGGTSAADDYDETADDKQPTNNQPEDNQQTNGDNNGDGKVHGSAASGPADDNGSGDCDGCGP
jgi:hypothetical protein